MRFTRREKAPVPGGVRFLRTERTDRATYHVHSGPGRAAALEFLRRTPVRDELVYTVVETPEGTFGRDLIYIFDEADGALIELGVRTAGSTLTPSSTRCAWCEHTVVPYDIPLDDRTHGSGPRSLDPDGLAGLVRTGGGFGCGSCALLQCAVCSGLSAPDRAAGVPHCRACGRRLSVHTVLGVGARAPRRAARGPAGGAGGTVTLPADPLGDELWGMAPLRVRWSIDVTAFLADTPLPYLWPDNARYREYMGSRRSAQTLLRESWTNVFLHHPNPDVVRQCLRAAPPRTMLSVNSLADVLESPSFEPELREEAARAFWGLPEGLAGHALGVLRSRGIVASGYDSDSVHLALGALRATCPPDRTGWLDAQLARPEDD
ncbi:hypothetical protein [Streptomyces sp. CA2R106]|uniref:hypothetical protein n=1 Tax=Streptomyces sp. CA2R106 TaxID=3120153 RepID=UPI00300965E9